jgi:hypothetical protein
MSETPDPVDPNVGAATPVGFLDLDGVKLPVFDLETFDASDLHRVSSFSTNFGHWELPPDVGALLGVQAGQSATLEWIHDTGELVLLGGVPTEGNVAIEQTQGGEFSGIMPGFLGGTIAGGGRDSAGMIRDYVRSEVMPPGSRLAVLAHIAHGPKAHEILWGWHREHGKESGWSWLVERLVKLDPTAASADHLA